MSNGLDQAASVLFPTDGPNVRDVKFFPGNRRNVTPDAVAEQLARAMSAHRNGVTVGTKELPENIRPVPVTN